MNKLLSAKEKAKEIGVSLSGLAKTRHLYKHIKKSPRKFLYFQEEYRPIQPSALDTPIKSSSKVKRRGILPGNTRYHLCPSGSGEKLKLYNQMRSKMALEGKLTKEEQESLTPAMAIHIKDNATKIVEQEQAKKRSELMAQEERARKRDPSRYGGMIRGNRIRTIDVSTPWKNLYETPRSEYDEALEELGEQPSKKNYYY